MKFVRYGDPGAERPGVLDGCGGIRDLSSMVSDIYASQLRGLAARLDAAQIEALPKVDAPSRLGVPLAGVGQIIAVGLNYASHIAEIGSSERKEPLLFAKSVHALCGPHDAIIRPRESQKLDWEVELVVVIGERCEYVEKSAASGKVVGYCTGQDISERGFQLERSGQWIKGKSAATFAPLGPWLVTPDEVDLDAGLTLWTEVDGARQQQASTLQLLHDVPALVSYISRFMILQPGDLIFTGTPEGVGFAQTPPKFLQPGMRLRCGVDGLGQQEHLIVDASVESE